MQRVHTSTRPCLPLFSSRMGWRLATIRRCARTRFIPTDCGLKPPIDVLPQIAHMRAMVREHSRFMRKQARRTGLTAGYYSTVPNATDSRPMSGDGWDGHDLVAALRHAAAMLHSQLAEVNALNVFPVPDGDTGSNMLATIQSAIAEAESVPAADRSVTRVAAAISLGAL